MSAFNAAAAYDRLGEAYLERERKIKQEMAVVSLLWLIGCPVLCVLPITKTGSLYGTPDEQLCGLITYSVSASMTGHYPKVLGSVMAPLFAVLVVQRSSSGLCSNLKLGWLVRFSPLVSGGAGRDEKHKILKQDEQTSALALRLWRRVEIIEFLGYVAGGFLVALVAFDSKYFLDLHLLFATVAFLSLYQQNRLVGTLGRDFEDVFPNWSCGHAAFVFYWGMVHLCLMYLGFAILGTVQNRDRCDDVLAFLDSVSVKAFGDPGTMRWLGSVAFWYNEYAFALMSIYVQLLEHYELQLWEFAGAENMPYMGIVSRFSVRATVQRIIGGFSDANVFLGIAKPSCNEDTAVKRQKANERQKAKAS